MNKGEAVAVQQLLDWVLSLDLFEVNPEHSDLPDEEIVRVIGVLADRSHAALGAGVDQGEAIAGAMRLFEMGEGRIIDATVPAAVDVVDLELPANAGSTT